MEATHLKILLKTRIQLIVGRQSMNIEFKEIGLEDRELFISYLKDENYSISDISFGNLYMWRRARKITYSVVAGNLLIQTTYEGQPPFYFFPIGKGDKLESIKLLFYYCQEHNHVLDFHSLELKNLDFLTRYFKLTSVLNRDRSDYVYSIPELIELSGRKYHGKKNHLNRFLQTYPDFKYSPIDINNAQVIKNTYEGWYGKLEDLKPGIAHEFVGICDVLDHWSALGLIGGVVSVGEKIIGFSFGELINENMAIIHVEKADSTVSGSYQIINQQLLKNGFNQQQYANREEDLGIEGLRKAKLSYKPVFLVDKYEAKILEPIS